MNSSLRAAARNRIISRCSASRAATAIAAAISSAASTEHHAVLNAFEHLQEREGFEVTFLRVNEGGRIDPDELTHTIRADTTLVSIMSANNETGVTQPMR